MDNLRVLVVDDNKVNCDLLVHHLHEFASVDVAYSGEDAMAKACQNQYDLILLDICLGAGMDGVEALKAIKNQERSKNTPVIAATGSFTDPDQDEFIEAGFDGFLSKPFTKQELMSAVQNILGRDFGTHPRQQMRNKK